uniref:protein RALF-like 34 n=1 Tax=Erigeron canadensis TaxID=72917 RepID=UPI001CB947A0|nr:protein RALF-like 34 [Erigeron canadensis]
MAPPKHTLLLSTLFLLLLSISRADVPTTGFSLHLATAADNPDWPPTMYYDVVDMGEENDGNDMSSSVRRSLFWKRMRYYISYGALSANRVPCPPRSGRSYYTHDCWKARGPAYPYTRGCSAITRCRR